MATAETVQAIFRFQLTEKLEKSERELGGREADSCCAVLRAAGHSVACPPVYFRFSDPFLFSSLVMVVLARFISALTSTFVTIFVFLSTTITKPT